MDNGVPNSKSNLSSDKSPKKCVQTTLDKEETEESTLFTTVDDGELLVLDQSVIEVKNDVSIIDLPENKDVENENANKENTTSTSKCLENFTICGDIDETLAAEDIKATGVKTKTQSCNDTLILEIDHTDNLDVYLEKKRTDMIIKEQCKTGTECAIEFKEISVASDQNTDKLKVNEKLNHFSVGVKCDEINTKEVTKDTNESSLSNATVENKKYSNKKGKLTVRSNRSKVSNNDQKIISIKRECDDSESIKKKIKSEVVDSVSDQKEKTVSSPVHNEVKVKIEKEGVLNKNNNEDVSNNAGKCEKKEEIKSDSRRFLWIYNLSQSTKATTMRVHLSDYGKVLTAKVVTDGMQYYGHVLMENRDDVENCIKHLNNTVFEGKEIILSDKAPSSKNCDKDKQAVMTAEKMNKERKSDEYDKTIWTDNRDAKLDSKRMKSRSRDPLTLKIKSHNSRYDRFSEERNKRKCDEAMYARKRSYERYEMRRERERREIEKDREERRRHRIREEENRQIDIKIEKEKRKLVQERQMIEKERYELFRLQKKLADTQRSLFNRQKLDAERDLRSFNEEFKKRRSPDTCFDRKQSKTYWKNSKSSTPLNNKIDNFNIENYPKKIIRDENLCAAPPPPNLSDNFDASNRIRKSEKERTWETRKDYSERPVYKGNKPFERKVEDNRSYSYSDRRDFSDKSYARDRFKSKDTSKYNKPPSTNPWDKVSDGQHKNTSSTWNNRTIQRYQPQSFIAPHFVPNIMPNCYPVPPLYGRSTDMYGRPPPSERKY